MPTKYCEVIDQYSLKKHGEIKDSSNVLKCIQLLKKGDIINIKDFAEKQGIFLHTFPNYA